MGEIKFATAGNSGPKVRSDCFVQIELLDIGGIQLDLKSKVSSLYGASIKTLVNDVFSFYGIAHARVELVDKGALPWVISARMEAAIKQLMPTEKEYLPDFLPENKYLTQKERFRFSRLYLPGNTPSMFLNAGLHGPDGIILDLEDAVAPSKKDEARILVRNALRACNFYGTERMVRINQGERGIEDLKMVIPHNVHVVLVPKIESADYIHQVVETIETVRKKHKLEYPVFLMPIVESALGVEMAYEIAKSSPNIVALAIGLEDYTADLGVRRTLAGSESLYARTRLVNACHAVKIQPIDSVFSDVGDMEGLLANVKASKSLGFEGMGCIHPRQVPVIKQGFAPEPEDIEKAKKIVFAAQKADEQGLGVVSLGTKMIDPPVVKRHMKNIDLALRLGLLQEGWEAGMEVETKGE
ncbi:MAG TPA: citrate lyase ACP [Marinilabiliales bacterium]|nr:citrate lyase ACP [Marinilabiliales bacterium]HAZ02556.1 citrate lyase ACP [Marinilabiliales bacterium]HBO76250.1 citrate lyase ACP [Marinilabiliales bacterium]HBX84087.1 citrate lyase ACP [Marinilabiliales bacterium]HBY52939.1 citrate lyase ACP [Marinilabiliales bacterium]